MQSVSIVLTYWIYSSQVLKIYFMLKLLQITDFLTKGKIVEIQCLSFSVEFYRILWLRTLV